MTRAGASVAVRPGRHRGADGCVPLVAADPADFARVLYARLREADARGVDVILAVPPASSGLGLAVLDRLTRAAAPR